MVAKANGRGGRARERERGIRPYQSFCGRKLSETEAGRSYNGAQGTRVEVSAYLDTRIVMHPTRRLLDLRL
jgi:hypothetical protein